MFDENTYPFPNFSCHTVDIWEWADNFIHHLMDVITFYICYEST